MSSTPTISVVVPCYNAAQWLPETVASVAAQSGVALELIVVDDGSTDDSVHVATQAAGGLPFTLVRQAQQGASAARTAGVAHAAGAFVQYLDADDVLAPDTLRRRLEALEQSEADVAYCDFVHYERDASGAFVDTRPRTQQLTGRPDIDLLTDAWWPPGALLYRRALVDRLEWRRELPVIQDARYALDAALAGARFVHVPGVGLRYRVHDTTSLSRRNPRRFAEDCFESARDLRDTWRRGSTLDEPRRKALASVFAHVAESFARVAPDRLDEAADALFEMDPGVPPDGAVRRALSRTIGYRTTARVMAHLHHAKQRVRGR